jgi:small-conductance mechanosensitive channel
MPYLNSEFLDNPLRSWLIAAAVATIVFAALRIVRSVIVRQLRTLAARTSTDFDTIAVDVLDRTRGFFLLFISLYAGLQVLVLPPPLGRGLQVVGVVVLVLQAGLWGNVLISSLISRRSRQLLEEDAAGATTVTALGFIVRIALWWVLLLVGLSNLGIDITAFIAGFGIGGIAVALAVQNILGDLLASLSIVLDKPFVIGDFIIVGEQLGTVEHVGLKTTRLRSLSGEQLIFSNSDLLNSRIRNFKRMFHRRVVFGFGVTYQTPYDKVARIGGMVRSIIEGLERTRFDRAHFKEYGDFALVYEVVYHVLDPDFNVYMDIQQAINLEIYRQFAEEGISFAYPTQTLYVARSGNELMGAGVTDTRGAGA